MACLCAVSAGAFAPACASRAVTVASDTALDKLRAADALVSAGCLDCLTSAFHAYGALRSEAATREAATLGAFRAATLAAIRERELGVDDSGFLTQARDIAAGNPLVTPAALALVEIAESLPTQGGIGQPLSDDDRARRQRALQNRTAYQDQLRTQADADPLSAYLWLSFNCAYDSTQPEVQQSWLQQLPRWRETRLIRFKAAVCGRRDVTELEAFVAEDPRFVEAHYLLGLAATLGGRLDAALGHFEQAYVWRPRWPAVTSSIAAAHVAREDFEQAIVFFDRTLELLPQSPEGLLGKARALTFLGRYTAAIDILDTLLSLGRWFIGEAHYWRAYGEHELRSYDAAWRDVEAADKLVFNSDVPKLAGLISYKRGDLDLARRRFLLSLTRFERDCETLYFLGMVLVEQRDWSASTERFTTAASCLGSELTAIERAIEAIRRSSDPPDVQARQIARREQRLAGDRRMLATSWFNLAVSHFNLARREEARTFAEKVLADPQFGARAKELLDRLR